MSIYGPGFTPGNNDKRFGDKGKFYACNPTAGTGIASTDASTSYDETDSLITIYNSSTSDVVIRPNLLRLVAKAVNTSATDFYLVGYLDAGDRYTSGGTTLTAVNTAIDSTNTSGATINFGSLVTTAASANARKVFQTMVSDAIFTADESISVQFGDGHPTSIQNSVVVHSFAIPAGYTLTVHGFGTAQAADPAFECEFIFTELGL